MVLVPGLWVRGMERGAGTPCPAPQLDWYPVWRFTVEPPKGRIGGNSLLVGLVRQDRHEGGSLVRCGLYSRVSTEEQVEKYGIPIRSVYAQLYQWLGGRGQKRWLPCRLQGRLLDFHTLLTYAISVPSAVGLKSGNHAIEGGLAMGGSGGVAFLCRGRGGVPQNS